jgi:hypothetical protein
MILILVILAMCIADTQQTCQDINAGQPRISNQNECWVGNGARDDRAGSARHQRSRSLF